MFIKGKTIAEDACETPFDVLINSNHIVDVIDIEGLFYVNTMNRDTFVISEDEMHRLERFG